MRSHAALGLVLGTAALVACSSVGGSDARASEPLPADGGAEATPDAPPDAGADADAAPPAPIVFPRAATSGGRVIATPKLMVVTFAGDALEPSITQFNDKLIASTYFAAVAKEYGVGAISSVLHARLGESAPLAVDDAALATWLTKALDGTGPLGAPDPDTLYAIYYPSQTVMTHGPNTSCKDFGGYHGELGIAATHIGFAAIARCPSADPSLTDLDQVTKVASHEIFEWATDPLPQSDQAWHKVVPDTVPWALAFSAELGDLCDGRTSHTVPADLGFVVQSMWSNTSSTAGHAPCQPAVAPLFAALVPALSGHVTLPPSVMAAASVPPSGLVPGVTVAPATRVALPLHVHADHPTTTVFQASAVEGGASGAVAGLGLSLSRSAVRAGDDLILTVTAPPDFTGPSVVVLYLTGGALGETYTRWPLLVSP